MRRLTKTGMRWLALLCITAGVWYPMTADAGPQEDAIAAAEKAEALESNGEYAAALQQYRKAIELSIRAFGPDDEYTLAVQTDMGTVYLAMGDHAEAERIFSNTLKIRLATLEPTDILIAQVMLNLGVVYRNTNRDAEAESMYVRALRITELRKGPTDPETATILNNLGVLYWGLGQHSKAAQYLLRALQIRETKVGPNTSAVAQTLDNLAGLSVDMGKYAQAETYFQRILKFQETNWGPDHPQIAITLANLGKMYVLKGDLDRAEKILERSTRICEAKLGPTHPTLANNLNNLATVYLNRKDYAKAEPLYLRTLKIQEASLAPISRQLATTHSNLGTLSLETGQSARAIEEFDKSRRIIREYTASVLKGLSDREQLVFLETIDQQSFHLALTLGYRNRRDDRAVGVSYGWLLNGKAVAQQALAEKSLLTRDAADSALAPKIRQLLDVRKKLAELSLAVPAPAQVAQHRQQIEELTSLEQQLSKLISSSVGRSIHDRWDEPTAVREKLKKDAVLIDIARFQLKQSELNVPEKRPARAGREEERPEGQAPKKAAENGAPADEQPKPDNPDKVITRYMAWLVPPAGQGAIEIVDLGDADVIDAAVAKARKAIEQTALQMKAAEDEEAAEQKVLEPLKDLARLILEPFQPHLKEAKQLILSPDASLWLVPWASLPVEDGKYAIERWQIRYVISGRDLIAEKSDAQAANRRPGPPCVFADPAYDLDGAQTLAATRAVLRGTENQLALRSATARSATGLPIAKRLPATAVEARAITPQLEIYAHQAPLVYTDRYALEGVVKMVQSPRVLVLATHGYYLSDQSVKTAGSGTLSAGDSQGAPLTAQGTTLENPLLRCGLLFAGCNQPKTAGVDDGVLTGMEIVGCNLRGTELVVLSACETGVGEVHNGEGVAGLRQAFQLAGAQSVVSTLWRVPDAETAALMSSFFANLAAGQEKAEALRNAQLSMLDARRGKQGAAHPLFWAAFTLTGN